MLNSGGSSERLCCSSCSLRLAFSCSRFWCACLSSFASLCLRTTLRASSKIHTSARCSGDIAAQTSNVPCRCSYTRFSVSCTNFSARWIASFPSLLGERGEGLASSTLVAVAVATQAAFQTLNSFAKYLCSASSCWWLGGLKDHDVGVQVWVDEKSVGGGSRHWSARAGKSRERGSKLKGIEVASISRLKAQSVTSHRDKDHSNETYLVALNEPMISRRASSDALAVSKACWYRLLASCCCFNACRFETTPLRTGLEPSPASSPSSDLTPSAKDAVMPRPCGRALLPVPSTARPSFWDTGDFTAQDSA